MSKKRWALPCWFFFHGMAEKISKSFYEKEHEGVNGLISLISKNLPCPFCRVHASNYITRNPIKNVKTKDELKDYLYKFHNDVNKRIGHKVFEKTILMRYETINIEKAYIFFNQQFYGAYIVNHDFNHWRRNMVQEKVKEYLRNNWDKMFRQEDCK